MRGERATSAKALRSVCAQAVLRNWKEAAAESERGERSCQGHAGPGSHSGIFAWCSAAGGGSHVAGSGTGRRGF